MCTPNSPVNYFDILSSLRVVDLREIMTRAYLNHLVPKSVIKKSKPELIDRLGHLLSSETFPSLRDVTLKIYRQKYQQSSPYRGRNIFGSSFTDIPLTNSQPYNYGSNSSSNLVQIPLLSSTYSNGLSFESPIELPVHPNVVFKESPFYEVISSLVKPTYLTVSNSHKEYYFHLTAEQLNLMNEQSAITVHLRICPLELCGEQEDEIPSVILLKVNNEVIKLQFPIDSNNRGSLKYMKKPIDISHFIKRSYTEINEVQVTWGKNPIKPYVLAVHLVKGLSPSILVQSLKENRVQSADDTIKLIKKKLSPNEDSAILIDNLEVSLICPVGKIKMKLPCRATSCTHFQCFEAAIYLQMNKKKGKWVCPFCNNRAYFKDLIIDGLFLDIISKVPEECCDVQFNEDGSWIPLESTPKLVKSNSIQSPKNILKRKRPIEIILDDSPYEASSELIQAVKIEAVDDDDTSIPSTSVASSPQNVYVPLNEVTNINLSSDLQSKTLSESNTSNPNNELKINSLSESVPNETVLASTYSIKSYFVSQSSPNRSKLASLNLNLEPSVDLEVIKPPKSSKIATESVASTQKNIPLIIQVDSDSSVSGENNSAIKEIEVIDLEEEISAEQFSETPVSNAPCSSMVLNNDSSTPSISKISVSNVPNQNIEPIVIDLDSDVEYDD